MCTNPLDIQYLDMLNSSGATRQRQGTMVWAGIVQSNARPGLRGYTKERAVPNIHVDHECLKVQDWKVGTRTSQISRAQVCYLRTRPEDSRDLVFWVGVYDGSSS